MSLMTISMIIVVTTFGLANVIDNLVELGLSAIPSWVIVGFLYFLPLALILAEFASDTTKARGGIYSYMERGLGPTWAFVGTWSYFVANLLYLQSSFNRLPIRASLAVSGVDIFESSTTLLPFIGVAVCLFITYIATRGVGRFSRFADWLGKATLVLVALLVLVPLIMVLGKLRPAATDYSWGALVPAFDLRYFSTFAWLLFAVAGAEVAAPYVNEAENPQKNFPRAILATTLMIGTMYILATIAVSLLVPMAALTKATGLFDIWIYLAEMMGIPSQFFGRFCMALIMVASVGAYVVWMESPIRTMFAEVPKGSFPERFTRRDAGGTHRQAMWIQALVVSILILIPLISILTGTTGSENFIGLLNDMASLSLVIPYIFIALAYIQARRNGMDAPFKMVQSTPKAIAIGVLVLVVSAAGYLGAGLYALQEDPINWIYVATVYGGPIALIGLGLLLRAASLKVYARSAHSSD